MAAQLPALLSVAKARGRHSLASPEIEGYWEQPVADATPGRALAISGWAFSRAAPIRTLTLAVAGAPEVPIAHGLPRPDVFETFADVPAAARSGFAAVIPAAGPGAMRMVIWATLEGGGRIRCFERRLRAGCRLHRRAGDLAPLFRGALQKAAVAYKERRLPASPVKWVRLVRLYHRELTGQLATRRAGPSVSATASASHDGPGTAAGPTLITRLEELIGAWQRRLGRDPAILDCHSGLNLAAAFPRSTVFSPSAAGLPRRRLPYLDHTVDVVVIRSGDPGASVEAKRVATLAVVTVEAATEPGTGEGRLTVDWQVPADPAKTARVSIVVPVFDNAAYTNACLEQLLATLPRDVAVEVIVVDDASTDETAALLLHWAGRDHRVRVLQNAETLGFVQSCNRGAQAATGDILVFLNNDTLPQSGWLPPLMRLLQERPDAGAVGGKLLYPDGRLQEAGGVIFADGSGCNFGKYDRDSSAPLYSHVREVDYCSGVLLATWRALFLELGGFDTRFAPAYYEDADYCFAVRRTGHRVYYQPESVVVHFEGVSSGTDPSAGVKRYQEVNRMKFVEKWRAALDGQPRAPQRLDDGALHALAVRDRNTPRALVCARRMPEFDREGGSQRLLHLIQLLRDAGWAVSFVARDPVDGDRYARGLQQLGVATYAGGESADQLVARGRFDLAIFSFWDIAERFLPLVRSLSPDTRVIVDSVDLHFLRNARHRFRERADGRRADAADHAWAAEMLRELTAYVTADAVLTVSRKEADLLNDIVAAPDLAHPVPDMETVAPSPLRFEERAGIVFIGNFRHAPNVEALRFFCAEIVPRLPGTLLAAHPIYVVGNGLEHVEHVVGDDPRVRAVGWVPSVVPYLQGARASVVPLRHGAGTKRKLIQALMAGTPSVSTGIGIEGLDLVDGVHVRVADDPVEFAARLTDLIEDQTLWERLVIQGRALVQESHGRSTVQARFLGVVETVMARHGRAKPP